MSARILDGTAVARQIRAELADRVARFTQQAGRPPGLGIVLVGENAASEIYVRNKLRVGAEAGFLADLERLPASATLADVLALVELLNRSPLHDGILVQLPLPDRLGPAGMQAVFDRIDPSKDVDGCTPVNVGRLAQNRADLAPGTPSGIIELLSRSDIPIAGAHAVVIGRSDIVGKPMALLLLHRNATISVCHSKTRNLPAIAVQADILVAALGRPGFVRSHFVKPGATVVDVGTTRVDDRSLVESLFGAGSKRLAAFDQKGSAVVGDVHPEVSEIAGAITPVPGGVGPLTIAMLMANTLRAAELRVGYKRDP